MNQKKSLKLIFLLMAISSLFLSNCASTSKLNTNITYEEFNSMELEQQKLVFSKMSGAEVYALVKESSENWPVTAYDLVSPENAKEIIVLYDSNGKPHFNLSWPCYGGFLPESIASIGDLSGSVDVSRDGGDGGYSMSSGKNPDGSYPNDSQRSVPKSSANVRTGILDIDEYKKVMDIVTSGLEKEVRLERLSSLGYSTEISEKFISDQQRWLSRDEVVGKDNIADGAKKAGHEVEARYGYYGVTAPWKVGNLNLSGLSGQINTAISWGTLCASGIIHDTGTAEIR